MAEYTVDTLQIKTKVTGTKKIVEQADALDRLAESTQKYNDVANKARGKSSSQKTVAGEINEEASMLMTNFGESKLGKTLVKFNKLKMKVSEFSSVSKSAISKFSMSMSNASQNGKEFLSSITRIAKYRAIRFVLSQIVNGVKEGTTNLYKFSQATDGVFAKSMDTAATSLMYFKNSIGAMVSPLVNYFVPYIERAIDAVADFVNKISELLAAFTGASSWTKALKYAVKYGDTLSDASNSAKELKRTLLGFDEINKLNSQSDGSSGSGSSSYDYSKMFEKSTKFSALAQSIKEQINKIKVAIFGSMIVIGAALAFSGVNIPIGLALLALGVKGMYSETKLSWNTMDSQIADELFRIEAIVSVSSLAIGALLAFSGANVPLGIALLSLGAAGLCASFALNWGNMSDKTKQIMAKILAIVGAFSLVLGVILCLAGVSLPVGIALIALGATSIASASTISWNKIGNTVKGVLASILAIISGFGLVIGVLLCCSGFLYLGIPLIYASYKGVKSAVNLSSNPITEFVRKVMNSIINIIEIGVNWCVDKLNSLAKINIPEMFGGGTVSLFNISKFSIPRLAKGGTVDAGQMFIANESGPELVGNIGNKSGAANSRQIIEGITSGVATANAEQNYLLKEQNSILLKILNQGLSGGVSVSGIASASQRKNMRDGRTTIPVGT